MKGNDIRESYLSFFENKKDHLRLKSFSLIPKDDPSLLLIGAGMAPLKPFFTGKVECRIYCKTPYIFRNAGKLLLWRLFQEGSYFLGMGIPY